MILMGSWPLKWHLRHTAVSNAPLQEWRVIND